MSFDVFLQHFVEGQPSSAPREGVLRVLRSTSFRGPDACGFYVVQFRDGVDVEFSAKGLESTEPFSGCAFHIHGLGDDLAAFMLEVAREGQMAMIAAMDASPVVVASEALVPHLPPDLAAESEVIQVESPAELGLLLTRGLEAWVSYRKQVVGGGTPHS